MLIIDPASGAMWKLDSPPIDVNLAKSTAALTEPTLRVIDVKDVTPEMKEHLVKIK